MTESRGNPQPNEKQTIDAITAALGVGASAQATATSLSPLIGIPVPNLLPLLIIAMSRPMATRTSTLPSARALGATQKIEPVYRAQYVHAASQRLAAGLKMGKSRSDLLAAERRYFNQHIEAVGKRRAVAGAVDKAAQRWGDDLGWYAKMDSITSEECRDANGKNFRASEMPPIGYPGAVHPHCRCKPGKKHRTTATVYGVKTDQQRGNRKTA